MKRPYSVRATILTVLSMVVGWSFSANAEDQSAVIEVDPQPLAAALNSFSEQTGVQFAYVSTVADGIESPGTSGGASPAQALDSMLAETGLTYSFINDTTIVIAVSDDSDENHQGGDSDLKNLVPTPVWMAQTTTGQPPPTSNASTRQSNAGAVSVVIGKVTDTHTGANLKGALVTIEEAGQSTSTDDLGEFRFPSVAAGAYTLRVSYLGYETYSERILVTSDEFVRSIQIESAFDEIVVLGTKSGRMQALNQERTALNATTVINADQLGNFNGATISEALRRAPGIAFVPDAETGEGAQVIARGLEPDLNQVTLNGVRLLDGTGLGRSPDLSNILTESIESVTINNTLLPSQDSNGAGALIEIETKSPLDRPRRFASFIAEYGSVDGDFGDEFEIGGTVSSTFGSTQDFGASLSVSYRERERDRINYAPGPRIFTGSYFPADVDGNPIRDPDDIDPRTSFPLIPGVDEVYSNSFTFSEGTVQTETLSVTGSFEKQFGTHTNWRVDITLNERQTESFNSSVLMATSATYNLAPVEELGGEERFVFVTEDPYLGNPFGESFFGEGILGRIDRNTQYSPEDVSRNTTLSFQGGTSLKAWDFGYDLGYSRSESEVGPQYELTLASADIGDTGIFGTVLADRTFLSSEALANVTGDGRIVSVFGALPTDEGDFVVPLFNDAGFAFYNDLRNLPLARLQETRPNDNGVGDSYFGRLTARRNFTHPVIAYVETGVEYREDSFEAPSSGVFSGGSRETQYRFVDEARFDDFGLVFTNGITNRIGAPNSFQSVTRGSLEQFIGSISEFESRGLISGVTVRPADLTQGLETSEENLTAYVETQVNLGAFQMIGGFRLEEIEVGSTSFLGPFIIFADETPENLARRDEILASGDFVTESVKQTEIMPRLTANYRFSENLIARGSYFVTVSRPQLSNLTRQRSVTLDLRRFFGDEGNQPILRVFQGNPDLKPSRTHSFDFRIERYGADASVLKASVFYKRIEDPLQSIVEQGGVEILPEELILPAFTEFNEDLPSNVFVALNSPANGDDDNTIWGFDFSVERPLDFLPAVFEGLGIIANYTYTDSDSTRVFRVNPSVDPDRQIEVDGVPFDGSPEHQGTLGFTYSNYGVDASLFYSAQSRRLASTERFGLDRYDEAIDTLDLQASYLTEIRGSDVRFFVSANDLLRDEDDTYLRTSIGGNDGVPKYYTGGTYLGGRTIIFGVAGSFF